MDIISTDDPVALRMVVRHHLAALRSLPNWHADRIDHERAIVILSARLMRLCGDNDVRTPEAWRSFAGLKSADPLAGRRAA